jgi:maltooligosyltrehalose trehalohydrolase
MKQGAYYSKNGICDFRVWAPFARSVSLKLVLPEQRLVPLRRDTDGYWRVQTDNCPPGTRYLYRIDEEHERPDPASHFQPDGVHGPSQVVDHAAFAWTDSGWSGLTLRSMIMYEIHTGTFTPEGTFDAIASRLGYLKDLGINAIELMPVAQFPGDRNWGYDGVYPYAVQNSYGGPEGLKRLVDACHRMGMAVILDVVYNHLGPEGNYLWSYGPYFTDRYRTPWGDAVNYDGAYSDEVRSYFIGSALHWVSEYHIDALRIDAIHGIFDFSARHFLQELGEAVHARADELGRKVYVIPESDLNDVRVVKPVVTGGYGLDAQWNDDFHHCLHALLTGERSGYYEDFGAVEQMAKAYREGFVFSGQYSSYRKRRHGSSSKDRPAHQFVVFSQNHDQVGNRMRGERLASLVSFEALKLAAGVVILSPAVPMLFMGEEYGETAPFQYFVSHGDEGLIEAVRKGRREEFKAFGWEGEVPDPLAEETLLASTIDLRQCVQEHHQTLFGFYKELLRLRKETASLNNLSKADMEVRAFPEETMLYVRRWQDDEAVFFLFNFNKERRTVPLMLPDGLWSKMLDSSDVRWDGGGGSMEQHIESPGQEIVVRMMPQSFMLYRSAGEAR